jgi:hypothetical protein
MVPQGYPRCRYIVANGLIKDPKEIKNRFVREIYPVRESRVESWKTQMQNTWAEYQMYLAQEKALRSGNGSFDVRRAWQQRYAACHTRRYGKSIASYLPRYPGEFIPDGGKCHRFDYCLHDNIAPEIPCDEPKALPMTSIHMQPPVVGIMDCVFAHKLPEMATPSNETLGGDIAPLTPTPQVVDNITPPEVQQIHPPTAVPQVESVPTESSSTGGTPTFSFRYKLPESADEIVYLGNVLSEATPICQVPRGETVYVHGSLVWITENVDVEGRPFVLLPGNPKPLAYDPNTLVYIVEPIFKAPARTQAEDVPAEDVLVEVPVEAVVEPVVEEPKVEEPKTAVPLAERLAEPWPEEVPVVPQPAPEPPARKPAPPAPVLLGAKLGVAPLSGVGVAPVLFLGVSAKGGTSLRRNMERAIEVNSSPDCFGAALVGRTRVTRRLTMLTLRVPAPGEAPVLTVFKKSEIGSSVWVDIEKAALQLVATIEPSGSILPVDPEVE